MVLTSRDTSGGYEITYGSPSSCSTSTWIEYGDNYGTASTASRIKMYRAGTTSSSCQSYQIIDDSTNCDWGFVPSTSAVSTACNIQWSIEQWGNKYKWQNAIVMSAEEKKVYEEKQFKERFSQIVQGRCAPNIIVRQNTKRKPLPIPADIREQRARETLRRVIGDQKYINFIKNGFISVKGRSGLVYQIFTGHGITHVFDQGNLVDRLCVVLNGGFPPTDSLIMRYLLILNNESQFRKLAIKHSIKHWSDQIQQNSPVGIKSLTEIFKELKCKVA